MTEMLKKEFSRKSFVKGGGAMIVGLSVAGAGVAGKAQGAIDPYASPGPANPNAVDSFIIIHADNTASLKSGRIELGQGSTTGLRTIVAEELDMDTNQLRHISFDTGGPTPSPNTGNTGGSTSISQGGPLVRRAAAEAKLALLALASTNLGVPVSGLSVSKGVVSGGGKTVTYGQLVGDKLLNVTFATTTLNAGVSPAKPISAYTQVGKARVARDDIPQIVTGVHPYAVNVRIPGMYHAPRRPASRSGRLRRRHEPGAGEDRRKLDQEHPERPDRARRQRPGRRRAEGVRRDPGRGPAQGPVVRSAADLRQRQPLEVDARLGQRRQGAGTHRGPDR